MKKIEKSSLNLVDEIIASSSSFTVETVKKKNWAVLVSKVKNLRDLAGGALPYDLRLLVLSIYLIACISGSLSNSALRASGSVSGSVRALGESSRAT